MGMGKTLTFCTLTSSRGQRGPRRGKWEDVAVRDLVYSLANNDVTVMIINDILLKYVNVIHLYIHPQPHAETPTYGLGNPGQDSRGIGNGIRMGTCRIGGQFYETEEIIQLYSCIELTYQLKLLLPCWQPF